MERITRNRWPVVMFIFIVIIGGLNALGVRYTVLELPPFWGATLRFAPAAVILLLASWLFKLPLPRGRAFLGAALYGSLNFAFSYGFLYIGLQKVQAGMAQVILALAPLFTFFFAIAHRQENFRLRGLFGALIAVGGITIVFSEQLRTSVPFFSVLTVILGAACLAEGGVLVKGFPRSHPITTNAVGMSAGAVILFLLSLLFHEPRMLPIRPATWIAVVFLVLLGSCALFILVVNLLKVWPASTSAYAFVLFPFVSLSVSAWLTGEALSPLLAVGAVLVLFGTLISIVRLARPPAALENPTSD